MPIGMIALVVGYVLSQFYRAFLAVLSPVLNAEIGAGPEDLAMASGLWFVAFAVMQIPVGWALDNLGPRRTASVLFAIGGAGGAAVMALAQGPGMISISMILIGIGCAPILMASYYILARNYPVAAFATFAGMIIGVGSLGNIGAALPLAWAVEALGWRETMWALSGVTLAVSILLAIVVKDPPKLEGGAKGSVLDLLRIPALWLIFPMMLVNYAPAAGIRGLWIGPYLQDVFGADVTRIGTATLVMGLAMVAGNLIYGPLDRVFGTRKWIVFFGNCGGMACLFLLWLIPAQSIWAATALLAAIGFFGASFAVIIAHGRSFIPPHLMGRGVSLMNLFGIGGTGIMQFASGPVFLSLSESNPPAVAYGQLFAMFGITVAFGLAIYMFSRDRLD